MARRGGRNDLFLTVGATVDPLTASMRAGRSALNEFGLQASTTTAEIEREFQKLANGSPAQAARQIEQAYDRSFKAIRDNLRSVMEAPSGQAALTIIDAGAAQQAAAAAETQAASLRQVAEAARRVAAGNGENANAARVYAAAAEAAAIGADRQSQELREQAAVLNQVETEVRQLTGAVQQNESSGQRVTVSANAQRAAMQNLSFQLNDVAVGFAAGTPPMVIFAQQGGQIVQAMQMMNNGGSKFLSFLGGPWGLALTSAMIALTPFISKLLEGNETLEDAVDKLAKDADATDRSRQAKELFNKTLDGTIERQRELNDQMERSLRTQQQVEQGNLQTSRRNAQILDDAVKNQEATVSQAERRAREARERVLNPRAGTDPGALPGMAAVAGRLEEQAIAARERLERLRSERVSAQEGIRSAEIVIAQREVAASLDASLAAQEAYTKAEGDLIEQRQRNLIGDAEFRRRLAEEQKRRDAALEAEQKRKSAERNGAREQGTITTFQSPVSGSTTGRFGENRGTHSHSGIDYAVPVGTPVRAAATGAVDFANQRGAYGNLIVINHGAGTSSRYAHLSRFAVGQGDRVEAGDVIGYSGGARGAPGSGRSTGPHLHYEVRRGNRAVNPLTGKFQTDTGGVEDAAAKAEERVARETQKREDDARAYQDLLARARYEQLDIIRRQTTDITEAANLDSQMVDIERQRRDDAAQAGVDKGRWTQAEADALKLINAQNAVAETQLIRQRQATELLDQQLLAQRDELTAAIAMLDLQGSLATTNRERRRIALQILEKETALARQEATRLIGSANPDDQVRGEALMRRIEAEEPVRRDQVNQQYAGPMDSYRSGLIRAVGNWDEALESVEARGLSSVEDSLVDIISGTEDAATAFKRMAASIIADLARIAVQKLILSVVGGGFAEGGKVDAFASGGLITGPGTGTSDSILALVGGQKPIMVSAGESIVTADATRRYWPLIDAMNRGTLPGFADGGVVPSDRIFLPRLPSAKSMQRAPAAMPSITFDMRGAFVPEQFMREVERKMAQVGIHAMLGGSQLAQQEIAESSMQVIPT